MTVVLVTGFEPYHGAATNPSGDLARLLDGAEIGGASVAGRVLPVSAASTPALVREAIEEIAPDAMLMLGVWPGKFAFQIERIAVNVLDFPFPDNDGAQPFDEPVVEDAPAAYFSRVPLRAISEAWRLAALPGIVSNNAGTYLCNQSYFVALHHTLDRDLPVGFVHLPSSLEEASKEDPPQAGLPLATLADGVRAAFEAIVAATPSNSAATSDMR